MSNKMSLKEAKSISTSILLKKIEKMKKELKKNDIWISICKKYDLDIDELDYVPMTFADIDVSAKCDHGIIYFNYKLLCDDFEKNYGYALHELTHFAQQTAGNKPTKSSDDGNYLHNPYEQEGFANQVEYIADEFGVDEAEDYVDDLLKHHDVKDKDEKDELEAILLDNVEE